MNKKILNTVFDATAPKYSESIAVIEGQRQIDYADFITFSNIIANLLIDLHVQREEIVGVFLDHSIEYTASIVGVMKSGAVFMPINPEFPESRNRTVLEKTTPRVIITTDRHIDALQAILAQLSFPVQILALSEYPNFTEIQILSTPDATGNTVALEFPFNINTELPSVDQDPDDGAYIIHTSGTTGEPKVILGQHKGLSHFIHWEVGEFGIDNSSRISVFAPPTFDVSLRDIFVPLLSGGTVCIPPDEVFENTSHLVDWISETGLTLVHIVPSLFRLLLSEVEGRESQEHLFPNLKHILLAGEPLLGRDINRWRKLFGTRTELVNLYGPSETTLAKCFNRLEAPNYADEKIVPVGNPISNTAVLIIKDNQLCPIGTIGEVHIKTPFMSKGYYKNPELMAQVFIQNPLNPERDIIYKTGDMGRYLPDRSIELLGRMDRQVKVNGNRIELGDIESSALKHPDITQCFVNTVMRQENMFLVCYYTGKPIVTPEILRAHLYNLLPDYAVPSFFVRLEQFPLNINGKIDKRKLPRPEEILYSQIPYEAPTNDYEAKLAAVWAKILGLEKVGVNNQFFDLGGTSLTAIKLASEIFQAFKVNMTLRDILHNPTVRLSAKVIRSLIESETVHATLQSREETTKRDTAGVSHLLIDPLPKANHYPISAAQRRVWFLHQLPGGDVVNNMPGIWRINGELNVDLIEKAFHRVIDRHESLRTGFEMIDGQPRQVVHDKVSLSFEILGSVDTLVHDGGDSRLRGNDGQGDGDSRLRGNDIIHSIFRQEKDTPFDLAKPPLMRCKVIKISPTEHVVLLTMHHIIGDGLSLDVVANELFMIYRAFRSGKDPVLSDLSIHYKDWSVWQDKYLKSEQGLKHRDYWHNQFAEKFEPVDIPTDFPRKSVQTFAGKTCRRSLPEGLYNNLVSLARKENCSIFAVLNALLKSTIYRYTGQTDITIGTAVAGRTHPQVSNQIGLYANLVALRDSIDGDGSFNDFLKKVKSTLENGIEHQSYPYDQLVEELKIDRSMSRSPLFDITIALQEDSLAFKLPEGLTIDTLEYDWEMTRYDMMFTFKHLPDGMQLDLAYNPGLYSAELMELLVDHLIELGASVVAKPDVPIDSLNMLPLNELESIKQYATFRKDAELPVSVIHLIHDFARQHPDHPALSDGNRTLSYSQLVQVTDSISQNILSHNVHSKSIIAMMMGRGLDAILIQIGIMKSGNVYVPIEPSHPHDRRQAILDKTDCQYLVTDEQHQSAADKHGVKNIWLKETILNESADEGVRLAKSDTGRMPVLPEIKSSDLAYILFTSGSTGMPKGVMIEHGGLVNSIAGMAGSFGVTPNDHAVQFASLVFDASMCEVYTALISGATLYVLSQKEVDNIDLFYDFMNNNRISLAVLPPILVHNLNRRPLPNMRMLVTAGDSPYNDDVAFYMRSIKQHRLEDKNYRLEACGTGYINAYGPTECSICISTHYVDESDLNKTRIPIGKPIPNLSAWVLDRNHNIVPIGVPGELYATGIGVGRGYLNEDKLTKDAFVEIPNYIEAHRQDACGTGIRAYRTGDLVRWLPDGSLEYLGRIDKQVKIRGYRIELGEIEQALAAHPEVDTMAVIVMTPESGQKHLVAFYAVKGDSTGESHLLTNDLRRFLNQRLPEYMIPQYFLEIDSIPVTTSGKIDRRQLETIFRDRPQESVTTERPLTELETRLKQIWLSVLQRDKIGVDDDFFAIGGDSIKAIQIIARLYQDNLQLSVADIFEHSSIAGCASVVQKVDKQHERQPVSGPVPLTAIQEWFFQTHKGNLHHFHQSTTILSKRRIDSTAFRSALTLLLHQHDMLRAVVRQNGINFTMEILPDGQVTIEPVVKDLRNDNSQLESEIESLHRSINIFEPPLIRVGIFNTNNGDIIHVAIHHLVVDGVSWRILMEDLFRGYEAILNGQDDYHPLRTSSFQDWSQKIKEYSESVKLTNEISYWNSQLAGAAGGLKYDYPIDPDMVYTSMEYKTWRYSLESSATSELTTSLNRIGIETDNYLLAIFSHAIMRQQGSDRLIVQMEGHGREPLFEGIDITRTVGWFTSAYPLKVSIIGNADIEKLITNLAQTRRTIPDNGLGYGILRYLTSKAQLIKWNPAIRFNYLGQISVDQGNDNFEILEGHNSFDTAINTVADIDLSCEALISNGRLIVNLSYNTRKFSADTIRLITENIEKELKTGLISASQKTSNEGMSSQQSHVSELLDDLGMDL